MNATVSAAVPGDDLEALIASVTQAFSDGATLGDLMGYEERDYEAVYALGHNFYSQARYLDALKAFSFLVMNNPLERRFSNAMASSLQMLKQYDNAIGFYSLASFMDIADPRPTFHTAECMIALKRMDQAVEALEIVIDQSNTPEFEALKTRAEALLGLIKSPQAAGGGESK